MFNIGKEGIKIESPEDISISKVSKKGGKGDTSSGIDTFVPESKTNFPISFHPLCPIASNY